MFVIIGDIQQFIGNCLIPFDPWYILPGILADLQLVRRLGGRVAIVVRRGGLRHKRDGRRLAVGRGKRGGILFSWTVGRRIWKNKNWYKIKMHDFIRKFSIKHVMSEEIVSSLYKCISQFPQGLGSRDKTSNSPFGCFANFFESRECHTWVRLGWLSKLYKVNFLRLTGYWRATAVPCLFQKQSFLGKLRLNRPLISRYTRIDIKYSGLILTNSFTLFSFFIDCMS